MSELLKRAQEQTRMKMNQAEAKARQIIHHSGVNLRNQLELSQLIFDLEEMAYQRGKYEGRIEGFRAAQRQHGYGDIIAKESA